MLLTRAFESVPDFFVFRERLVDVHLLLTVLPAFLLLMHRAISNFAPKCRVSQHGLLNINPTVFHSADRAGAPSPGILTISSGGNGSDGGTRLERPSGIGQATRKALPSAYLAIYDFFARTSGSSRDRPGKPFRRPLSTVAQARPSPVVPAETNRGPDLYDQSGGEAKVLAAVGTREVLKAWDELWEANVRCSQLGGSGDAWSSSLVQVRPETANAVLLALSKFRTPTWSSKGKLSDGSDQAHPQTPASQSPEAIAQLWRLLREASMDGTRAFNPTTSLPLFLLMRLLHWQLEGRISGLAVISEIFTDLVGSGQIKSFAGSGRFQTEDERSIALVLLSSTTEAAFAQNWLDLALEGLQMCARYHSPQSTTLHSMATRILLKVLSQRDGDESRLNLAVKTLESLVANGVEIEGFVVESFFELFLPPTELGVVGPSPGNPGLALRVWELFEGSLGEKVPSYSNFVASLPDLQSLSKIGRPGLPLAPRHTGSDTGNPGEAARRRVLSFVKPRHLLELLKYCANAAPSSSVPFRTFNKSNFRQARRPPQWILRAKFVNLCIRFLRDPYISSLFARSSTNDKNRLWTILCAAPLHDKILDEIALRFYLQIRTTQSKLRDRTRTPLLSSRNLLSLVARARACLPEDTTLAVSIIRDFVDERWRSPVTNPRSLTPSDSSDIPPGLSHEDLSTLAKAFFLASEHSSGFRVFETMLERRLLPDAVDVDISLSSLAGRDSSAALTTFERALDLGLEVDANNFKSLIAAIEKGRGVEPGHAYTRAGSSRAELSEASQAVLDLAEKHGFGDILRRDPHFIDMIVRRQSLPDAVETLRNSSTSGRRIRPSLLYEIVSLASKMGDFKRIHTLHRLMVRADALESKASHECMLGVWRYWDVHGQGRQWVGSGPFHVSREITGDMMIRVGLVKDLRTFAMVLKLAFKAGYKDEEEAREAVAFVEKVDGWMDREGVESNFELANSTRGWLRSIGQGKEWKRLKVIVKPLLDRGFT